MCRRCMLSVTRHWLTMWKFWNLCQLQRTGLIWVSLLYYILFIDRSTDSNFTNSKTVNNCHDTELVFINQRYWIVMCYYSLLSILSSLPPNNCRSLQQRGWCNDEINARVKHIEAASIEDSTPPTQCSTPTRITMSEWERGQGGYSVPVRLVKPRIRNYILKMVGLKGTIIILWVVVRH